MTETETQAPAGPLPHGRGRRLIQMLFTSGSTSDDRSSREPRETMLPTSPVAINYDTRSEDEAPVSRSNLSALKRRLFPKKKRRHPARIPPLVVSPITTGTPNNQPDFEMPQRSTQSIWNLKEDEPATHDEAGEDEDIDDDLVDAIEEADRLRSTTSEETINQMNQTIEALQQWKAQHELETQNTLREMEESLQRELADVVQPVEDDAVDTILLDAAEKYQRAAEIARSKLLVALQDSERTCSTKQHPDDHRVTQVLLDIERQSADDPSSEGESNARLMAKLREEVFELGVREISSSMHSTWMQELEGAENELELKMLDVEAFASDLDQVLAQFETSSLATAESSAQNPSGQQAHEH